MPGNRYIYERFVGLVRTTLVLASVLFVVSATPATVAGFAPAVIEGSGARGRGGELSLGAGVSVAEGVTLYRPDATGPGWLPAPLAVQALSIDPRAVDVTTALAMGRQQGRATVAEAARRSGAIAAVNAGFFALATGDPTGVLRVDGHLVSDARLMRGAVAIAPHGRGLQLTFDRVRVRVALAMRVGRSWREVPLDGVDTVRHAGGATLYTSRYGADTGTPPVGVEWPLSLAPDAAKGVTTGTVKARIDGGHTPVPGDGGVLSFGGSAPPAPLDRLKAGDRVRVRETWETGSTRHAGDFARADDVVGGAGMLVQEGRAITDWAIEQTSESLRTVRHPRTMIGTDARGTIWLVTVDGRQPGYSVGLTLPELARLALGLGLTDALNLDGGGSTTMVVRGEIVNRPSDPTGPRPVSDVLLVRPRPGRPPAAPR